MTSKRSHFREPLPTYGALAASGAALALAVLSGCFEEGARLRREQEPAAVEVPEESATSTPPVVDPVPGQGGSGADLASDELDAGPIQFQFARDGSTTPTAEYVRGVDATAAEDARGFADAGADAN